MASDDGVLINEKSMEILVAKFIPTSQYFERSFEVLQTQIGDLKDGQKDLKREMDRRFEQVDKRFEQVDKRFEQIDKRFEQIDKRFEQIDKRFEQVDKRFEQINVKLDTIIERMDTKIDAGLRENRAMSFKLFSFAMVFSAISMAGLLGKLTGLF
jgi:chromosome segregation ATPase